MGSNWAKNTCLKGSILAKHAVTPFGFELAHFQTFLLELFWGAKRVTMGSKRVKNISLGIPMDIRPPLETYFFEPLFGNLLWSQNDPFLSLFGSFGKPKQITAPNWINHLFDHPKWSRNNFEKIVFDHSDPEVTPLTRIKYWDRAGGGRNIV